MVRLIRIGLAMLALLVAACGEEGDRAGAPGRTTTAPDGELRRCHSPAGFAISTPTGWATNEGDVVPRCTQFHPEPFEVPAGTDERVSAIHVYVEPVAFATAARPQEDRDEDRAVTTVEGRQAVRLSYETTGDGFYPPGTPVTRYLVDFERAGGEAATLIADTVGTPPFDYERNVVVLDRMFQTLEITDPAVETDPSVIATYLGGGGGFSVVVERAGGSICLRIPPNGEPACAEPPPDGAVHAVALQDLRGTVPAGVAGANVWRVDLVTVGDESHSYLPASVPGTNLGAYAFHDTVGEPDRLVLYDVTGTELRTVRPGEA